ncbi:bacterioferritin [Pseudoxanthobacter soli DSM 19599]|uniref:Bacterioferritin n=1 Tax=Pseudoxanthobacter soli DSM 19599 TaxID=1123029 RepID=A0A1M7Z9D2_9HYPH|nr:bacterioferritin [Pseudoxanthobacter soli]SHO61548.1 bacterioferritin [Pseudoxanthobacter soli DSM 19599]
MKGDPEVLEILNKSLKHELAAINQYWLHYRLLDDWGFTLLAKKEREESIEEMHHADKLVTRIIFLEGHPNLQTLDTLRIGENIKEVLECDLAAEYSARALYKQARELCRDKGDYVTMELFEDLLEDEESHIDFIETQLQLLESIGVQKYGQLQAAPANEA